MNTLTYQERRLLSLARKSIPTAVGDITSTDVTNWNTAYGYSQIGHWRQPVTPGADILPFSYTVGDDTWDFPKSLRTSGDFIAGTAANVTGFTYIGAETGAGSAVTLYNGNLNDINSSCILHTITGTNRPVSASGFVQTYVYDASESTQLFYQQSADYIYFRRKTADIWQSWVDISESGLDSAEVINIVNTDITINAYNSARLGGQNSTYHLSRANHTGTQAHTTITGLGSLATKSSIDIADITDKAVTYAKIQDVTTARVLGRITAGAGVVEELTGANVRTIADVAQKQQSENDTTTGRGLIVGSAFGLGAGGTSIVDYNAIVGSHLFGRNSGLSATNAPTLGVHSVWQVGNNDAMSSLGGQLALGYSTTAGSYANADIYIRGKSGVGTWDNWLTVYHTGNIRSNADNDGRYGQLVADNTWTGINTFTTNEVRIERESTTALRIGASGSPNQQLIIGVSTLHSFSEIQSVKQGTGYTSFLLNRQGGSVGIGTLTVTSGYKLDVVGSVRAAGLVQINAATPSLELSSTAAFSTIPTAVIYGRLKYNTAGAETNFGRIVISKDNATDGNTGGFMAFYKKTAGATAAEAMRLHSSGGLSIGSTALTSGYLLDVNGDIRSTGDIVAFAT